MYKIAALVPVIVVAYGLQQYRHQSKIDHALTRLKSSGFRIRYRLEGSVLVVVDDTTRQVAFVFGSGTRVHTLDEVRQCDWLRPGPSRPKPSNAIQFSFHDERTAPVIVRGLDEADAERWMERMDVLLSGW